MKVQENRVYKSNPYNPNIRGKGNNRLKSSDKVYMKLYGEELKLSDKYVVTQGVDIC